MLDAKAGSSTSAKQREADKGQPSNSSGPVAPQKGEKYPPRYGAQHRQDALWEGGNEALPSGWTEIEEGDDQLSYWDDALFMQASDRPLPGVQLDWPWQLIPGCEWHISPLGRSYFVNHNTRTTSWKKPKLQRPAGSLMPECIIKRDSPWYNRNLACLDASGDIMSISDGAICQWTRDGKPVGKPFNSEAVIRMAVSPDGLMVVGKCRDGRVRLWNIKEGRLIGQPWEGNDVQVTCLDWSPNGAEVAGGLEDGTIQQWNTTTGRQIGSPIKKSYGLGWIWTIKYSPQGDKFASGGDEDIFRVWSKDGELLVEINGHDNNGVTSLCWSKDGEYIFSGSWDHTIRKWQSIDGKELVVIRGHTNDVSSLCLSPDGSYLVSASDDCSVRIWDLKTNQQVGDPLWHDDRVELVAMSSDGYFASDISGPDGKIHVWSLDAAFKRARGVGDDTAKLKGCAAPTRDISIAPRQHSNNRGFARYGNDFWGDDTNRTPHHSADTSSLSGLRNFFSSLRFSTRSANAPSIQRQPRRLNFSLFPVTISRRPVTVAPCREEDRYGITPESDAEAAAAMQRTNTNTADNSTQQGQGVAGPQGSHGRPTQSAQAQPSDFEAGEPLIGCCGFYLVRRRPASN